MQSKRLVHDTLTSHSYLVSNSQGHPERVNFQSNGQNLMVLQLWVFCLVRSLNLFMEVELKTKNEGQDKQEPLGAAPTALATS